MTDSSEIADKTLQDVMRSKFASDSLFNLIPVALLGVSGLLINIVIARKYNAAMFGAFNEVLACYVIMSQFATMGVQVSALKHTAQFVHDSELCKRIFTSGFVLVACSSFVFSLALFFLRNVIAAFFQSPGVATGLLFASLGLWFFAMNKLFLNVLNGHRRMKAYALAISFRYVSMLTTLIFCVVASLPGEQLSIIFVIPEILLFIVLSLYYMQSFSFRSPGELGQWMRRHLSFGLRSMVGGVSADLNTRVDVIILGYFSSDRVVGIYSLAATLVEGIMQIPGILKLNMDPILTRLMALKKVGEVNGIAQRWKKWTFTAMFGFALAACVIYPFAVSFVTNTADYQLSWPIFCILMGGVVIQSPYVPFSGILVQSGYPFLQTIHLVAFTLSNILLNLALVPSFGMYGAAVATALSFISFVVYLKMLAARSIGVRL